ncbi:hypothetical protein [Jiangella alkaliphila]|uniref:Uncharacterized protein n=1 Tax=Jiangella alkaliphila TaxID=419479 RepID=A0A1H2L725_9ACTN|nr:hypothetical protein [Jiangella alkaliphila]SDU76749.1 hypothetical protein SAMN04488563_5303 [Jiangella alkaliphila]
MIVLALGVAQQVASPVTVLIVGITPPGRVWPRPPLMTAPHCADGSVLAVLIKRTVRGDAVRRQILDESAAGYELDPAEARQRREDSKRLPAPDDYRRRRLLSEPRTSERWIYQVP